MASALNEVKHDYWIDGFTPLAEGEMEMRRSRAPCVAGDSNGFSSGDELLLLDQRLGQMAVADGVVTVADGDVVAAALVGADLDDLAKHHGIGFGVVGAEVKSVVGGFLTCERVLAGSIWRGDINGL